MATAEWSWMRPSETNDRSEFGLHRFRFRQSTKHFINRVGEKREACGGTLMSLQDQEQEKHVEEERCFESVPATQAAGIGGECMVQFPFMTRILAGLLPCGLPPSWRLLACFLHQRRGCHQFPATLVILRFLCRLILQDLCLGLTLPWSRFYPTLMLSNNACETALLLPSSRPSLAIFSLFPPLVSQTPVFLSIRGPRREE